MSNETNILIINSSVRQTRSITRELTALFLETFSSHQATRVIHRDVGLEPPSFINEAWISAAFTSEDQRTPEQKAILKESDQLIDEIARSDIIVLGVPMYNYSMPAPLKAWFDLIARVGQTFSFDLARGDYPIEAILKNKKLLVLSSRGEFGFEEGASRSRLNGLDPALRACAHYLGAAPENMTSVIAEYEEFKDERWLASVERARENTARAARQLAMQIG
ncbi:FMN-dependent NADH-azoreductase [Pseudoteredinibacter isoporae]|uniref:FMN-dependent NADH-azoreductase n=1 Tax=Pseudoteredinibacter isoporae TaxID=570281 RepID=UPI003341C89F